MIQLTDEEILEAIGCRVLTDEAEHIRISNKAQLKKVVELATLVPSSRAQGQDLMAIVWTMSEYEALLEEVKE